MMTFWKSLSVVIWKNALIRKKHWFLTILEILFPTLMFVLFAYARAKASGISKVFVNETFYNDPIDGRTILTKVNLHDTKLYYAPNTEFTEMIINKARVKLNIMYKDMKSFDGEDELIAHHQKYGLNDTILGVVFNVNESIETPNKLSYKLKLYERGVIWNTNGLYHRTLTYQQGLGSETYIENGFLPLQVALDTSYLEMLNVKLPQVTFEEFPYPPHYDDHGIMDIYMFVLPLITMFGYTLLIPAVMQRVLEEKSSGIRQLMKMMGLDQSVMWTGWFIHSVSVNLITIGIIVMLLKAKLWGDYPPIEYCDGSVLFFFLFFYSCASTSLCFLISTIFNKSNFAMIFGTLFWLLSYFIPAGFINTNYTVPLFFQLLLSLIPNMSLHFGYGVVLTYEIREVGIKWSNLNEPPTGGTSEMTMLHVFVMLALEFVVYLLCAVYIDNIKPGPYGVPKKLNYPLITLMRKRCGKMNEIGNEMQPLYYNDNVEASPLTPGIMVRNLSKRYGKTDAVNDMSMNIYEGEITVLLGRNGAGKTTTLSILTGMINATSGTIIIDNHDIRKDVDAVRRLIGICPQHNLTFHDLNVWQHLMFFAMLKGMSRAESAKECEHLLETLNLSDKKHDLPSNLSGGMKRRLCLGMALVGNPKVLVLDEPTSGLDVEARREIWDILLKSRKNKTTLITTHFMEEAEVLGDRIAIMREGQLICYGTPFFLKEKYGKGYKLQLKCKGSLPEFEVRLKEILRQYLGVNIESTIKNNDVTIDLPFDRKANYGQLFKALEDRKDALAIEDIGLTASTIESIFLTVGTGAPSSQNPPSDKKISDNNDNKSETSFSMQMQSLFSKQWYVYKRKPLNMFIHVVCALISIGLTLYLGQSAIVYSGTVETPLALNLLPYGTTNVYYSNDFDSALSKIYEDIATSQAGKPLKVGDVREAIVSEGIANIEYYKYHMVVGGEFKSATDDNGTLLINAMYSNTALHGAPISWNMMINAYLKSMSDVDHAIDIVNSPLHGSAVQLSHGQQQSQVQNGIAWLFMFPLGAYIMLSMFIAFPQHEYLNSFLKLQQLAGVKLHIYWLNCMLFDIFTYTIFVILAAASIGAYGIRNNPFAGIREFQTIIGILWLSGFTGLPYLGLFSRMRTTANAMASYLISSLLIGIVLTSVVVILELSHVDEYVAAAFYLKHVFAILPPFAITYLSVTFCKRAVWNFNWDLMTRAQKLHQCFVETNPCCANVKRNNGDAAAIAIGSDGECEQYMGYWNKFDSILLVMILSFFMFALVLCVFDLKTILKIKFKMSVCLRGKTTTDDGDLDNVGTGTDKTRYIAFKLKKSYTDAVDAVKDVTFRIDRGNCYGLLGVNGAGKSSVFKMLVGDEVMDKGNAYIITGDNVHVGQEKYNNLLGYCPQTDALNYHLTGSELLQCFARLRGVPNADKAVAQLLEELDLTNYKDVVCGKYSGGNKRKLNLALALISNPLVKLLDEPTTGVDPDSRRKIWSIIEQTKSTPSFNGQVPSILLTSHSMDECQALCDELAIMKKGEIMCEGAIPDLIREHSGGFCIKVKLKPKAIESGSSKDEGDNKNDMAMMSDAKSTIERKLATELKLIDEHSLSLHYRTTSDVRLSKLFENLDALVDDELIEDYSVTNASLEEVFLKVATNELESSSA